MKLATLINNLELDLRQGDTDRWIADLTDDSREVAPGSLFIARPGQAADGSAFIGDAIERGAAAILSPRMAQPEALAHHRDVTWLVTEPVDQALCGELAERFFDRPSRKLRLVGVTGTNGKTTTAFAIQHLLRTADMPAGLMGTVMVDDGASRRDAGLTTPGGIEFSRRLAGMVKNGCGAAVCEVSSHALEQKRTAALAFDVGVFTNLTGDHLDYHGSMEAYAAAKAKLFQQLPPEGWAIINGEDPHAERMVRDAECRVLWTTLTPSAQADHSDADQPSCRAEILALEADHSRARFDGPWGSFNVRLPLVGRHNVANTLQAAAAANVVVSLSRRLKPGLEQCPHVPGRLEVVSPDESAAEAPHARPAALVDYAHTHDALENVLLALEKVTRGALVLVFGCGGDRDADKRPKMAQVAARFADRIYVTSDNPRTEEPDAIIKDIMRGMPAHRRRDAIVEPDRAKAIRRAVSEAEPADTILIAGKGHETYQIVGKQTRHFDDREEAAAVLRRYGIGSRV